MARISILFKIAGIEYNVDWPHASNGCSTPLVVIDLSKLNDAGPKS